MKERTFKIILIWLSPLSMLIATVMRYPHPMLLPLWIGLPFGMFFAYILHIKGIEDGLIFKDKEEKI